MDPMTSKRPVNFADLLDRAKALYLDASSYHLDDHESGLTDEILTKMEEVALALRDVARARVGKMELQG